MSILIGALEFEGPVNLEELSNQAGVYGALCKIGSEYELIHLGQAARMRNDVEQLPERSLWLESGIEVQWAVHYTGDELNTAERLELIEDLERELDDIEDEVGIEQIA
jgi:hypothetical protein